MSTLKTPELLALIEERLFRDFPTNITCKVCGSKCSGVTSFAHLCTEDLTHVYQYSCTNCRVKIGSWSNQWVLIGTDEAKERFLRQVSK